MRTSRVVPPEPGNRPTRISGRPILALGLSAAMRWWQASPISVPMPIEVPGEAQTKGLPPLRVFGSAPARSILRSTACRPMMKPKMVSAGLPPAACAWRFIRAMTLRSMPPAKSFLALVMITPVTALSASAVSTWASSSAMPCSLSRFIEAPGRSQVMVAMAPSVA